MGSRDKSLGSREDKAAHEWNGINYGLGGKAVRIVDRGQEKG